MAIQRIDGLPAAYDTGGGIGDTIKKAADAAANVACGLYRDHPGFVLPPSTFGLLPQPQQAARGIWDSLCGGRVTLPPPPQVPYTGGQCVNVPYNVTRSIDTNIDDSNPPSTATFGAVGKLGSLGVRSVAGNQKQWFLPTRLGTATPSETIIFTAPNSQADKVRVSILSVAPVGTGANNCGNPPIQYPPTVPPASQTGGNTIINNNDGTDFSVPFAYIPVDITPTFSPQIRVDVGGLNVRFDGGGVDVQFPDVNPSPPGSTPFPDGGGSKLPPGGTSPPPAPSPTPGDDDFPPVELPETPGSEEDVPGIKFLEIVVTKDPDKLHFGEGGENVIFAGWVAFRAKSGGYYPRQQINFRQSVFPAPEGSDGYTLTFTNGAKGRAREYTEAPPS